MHVHNKKERYVERNNKGYCIFVHLTKKKKREKAIDEYEDIRVMHNKNFSSDK